MYFWTLILPRKFANSNTKPMGFWCALFIGTSTSKDNKNKLVKQVQQLSNNNLKIAIKLTEPLYGSNQMRQTFLNTENLALIKSRLKFCAICAIYFWRNILFSTPARLSMSVTFFTTMDKIFETALRENFNLYFSAVFW